MKHLLIILISFLLLSSPVIGNSHKGETLYLWGVCQVEPCDYKWMGFGDKDLHPIYKGQVMDGKPNGLGFLIYPDGRKYGLYHGQGTETSSNGIKYVGEWEYGFRGAQGTLTFPVVSKMQENGIQGKSGMGHHLTKTEIFNTSL